MDPTILDLTGVEIEIRAWRGTDNPFLVTVTLADGTPLNLSDFDATMTVTDRAGGEVKFTDTNAPADHSAAAAGQTRFVVPASTFVGLTGQRTYTWKYMIFLRYRLINQRYVVFYGDFRVLAPTVNFVAPIPVSVAELVAVVPSAAPSVV